MHSKGLLALASLLFFGLSAAMSAPDAAGLDGRTVQSASYFERLFPSSCGLANRMHNHQLHHSRL